MQGHNTLHGNDRDGIWHEESLVGRLTVEECLSERNSVLAWNQAGGTGEIPVCAVIIDSLRHDKLKISFSNIPPCSGNTQVITITIVVIKQIRIFFLDNGVLLV
jgi:hypothetical protein